ncbi:signal peptidase I [Endothiovibrio diazotrophicus]
MNFDFPTILTFAVGISGAIWAFDAALLAPRRRLAAARAAEGAGEGSAAPVTVSEPLLVEYARSFFPVLLAVLVLRSFLVEPFRIPSGSMMPTLFSGDFILVNKFTYGIRLPVINKKIIDLGDPQRGDVVVFRYPRDPSTDYIKRVVGLPGDRVSYYNKTVFINGTPAEQQYLGPYVGPLDDAEMQGAVRIQENLTGVEHQLLIRPQAFSVEGEFVVPEGSYFVMGDNRDNSNDSRYWGVVPDENLVGRAFLIWFHWGEWGRIGDTIH